MTRERGLSSAERSRQATKAALARQAEEKKLEEEKEANSQKQQEEEIVRRQAELKRKAIPIGDRLLFMLWADIKAAEKKGFKLELTFYALLKRVDEKLLEKTNEELACLGLNYAAERLREKQHNYKVSFGRRWSGFVSSDPENLDSEYGIMWGKDATQVPKSNPHSSRANYSSFSESEFPNLEIEVSWEEESK